MSQYNYKSFLSQFKRKQPGSTSSSSEADSPDISKQSSKRLNFDNSSENMDSQTSTIVTEMNRRFDSLQETLASKNDIEHLKNEMDSLFGSFMKRLEDMEEKVQKSEQEKDKLVEEIAILKRTNGDLFSKLNSQTQQLASLRNAQNDAEQYGRRWNLRVFNIKESAMNEPESGNDCIKKVCEVFSSQVGVPVTEEDIEVAHRVGRRSPDVTKTRPIIVRFLSRRKKDDVLAKRRNLKGNRQRISIGEDLTFLNYKLLKDAKQHSATLDAWSSNGRVIVKLKNGKTVRVTVDCDLDTTLRKEM